MLLRRWALKACKSQEEEKEECINSDLIKRGVSKMADDNIKSVLSEGAQ